MFDFKEASLRRVSFPLVVSVPPHFSSFGSLSVPPVLSVTTIVKSACVRRSLIHEIFQLYLGCNELGTRLGKPCWSFVSEGNRNRSCLVHTRGSSTARVWDSCLMQTRRSLRS